jgi:hypothetical protein
VLADNRRKGHKSLLILKSLIHGSDIGSGELGKAVGMSASSRPREGRPAQLITAIVLSTTELECTVVAQDQRRVVPYALLFPGPRTERVLPGHLVAIAAAPDGSDVVVWRWYDAVVIAEHAGHVRLWEPAHGEVLGQPRDPSRSHRAGSRAYLSAGLPGADWWVAGPAVVCAEDADVELDDVDSFFTSQDLWGRLT